MNTQINPRILAMSTIVCLTCTPVAFAEGGLMDALNGELNAAKGATEAATPAAPVAVDPVQSVGGSAAKAAADTSSPSLVDSLTSKLGVTPDQAEGGAGSLFNVAKEKLGAEDFQSVADAVPGMDGLLGAAPKSEAAGGLAGGLGGLGGDSVGDALNTASLVDNFKQLGLSSDMVGKFVPVVVDYVKTQGGETVANLLGSALTGL